MRKSMRVAAVSMAFVAALAFAGCSSGSSSAASSSAAGSEGVSSEAVSSAGSAASQITLENGEYTAVFNTDSSMFHVNEANDGKGTLAVSDDGATIHVSLVSKKITNLYVGTAADAEGDEANWLQPTTDEVTYSDGITDEVYGFDIPVPATDEEFDVAILGEKGTWYDHKVSVSDPVAI